MGLSSILSMAYELSLAQIFLPKPLICAHLLCRTSIILEKGKCKLINASCAAISTGWTTTRKRGGVLIVRSTLWRC